MNSFLLNLLFLAVPWPAPSEETEDRGGPGEKQKAEDGGLSSHQEANQPEEDSSPQEEASTEPELGKTEQNILV